MVLRHIERIKIVVIGLYFRTVSYLKSHPAKDSQNVLKSLGEGVLSSQYRSAAGQGNVDSIGSQFGLLFSCPQTFCNLIKFAGNAFLNLIYQLAYDWTIFRRNGTRLEYCHGASWGAL